MLEQRIGKRPTSLVLWAVVLGIVSWSLTPLTIAVFVVTSRINDLAGANWPDFVTLITAIGTVGLLVLVSVAGFLTTSAIVSRWRTKRATADLIAQEVKALEQQLEAAEREIKATEKETTATDARATLLRSFLNHAFNERERMERLSKLLIQSVDALENQEAIDADKAEEIRKSARRIAQVWTPRSIVQPLIAGSGDRASSLAPPPPAPHSNP